MDGISLSWRSLPQALIDRHALHDRVIVRSDEADREIRFLYRDVRPLLPVWVGDELNVVSWGRPKRGSKLPRARVVAQETIQAGIWLNVRPEPVDIPASFGWDRGVWYRIKEGVRGILVRDEAKNPVVYLLTEPASHYYQVMTRNSRMPVLVGERI
ncbi:MAG: hypothetical protein AB7I37_15625 [Pirellulales bacterium]